MKNTAVFIVCMTVYNALPRCWYLSEIIIIRPSQLYNGDLTKIFNMSEKSVEINDRFYKLSLK